MLSFNAFRLIVFSMVVAWTAVVLAIALHLRRVLEPDELTDFVPFALANAITTLFVMVVLLLLGLFRKGAFFFQTRVELVWLAVLGALWTGLGVHMTQQETAVVECFDEEDGIFLSDDTFAAQYRVLQAFSIFNAILIFGYFLLLLMLALRWRFSGKKSIWVAGVTKQDWFRKKPAGRRKPSLPTPVTAKAQVFTVVTTRDQLANKTTDEKPAVTRVMRGGPYTVWIPPQPPPATHTRRTHTVQYQPRPARPHRNLSRSYS